jgi:MoaA/NifB/PqqE/SkfB family radical SAM enzyme
MDLRLKGIEDGRWAFIGPKIVQIDLTGKCNNNCIGCWVHSPFIKTPPRDKDITLPFGKVKSLIENLASLGTEEVYLSGAGEPFLHPNILEIVELIKSKGIKLNIITNFILLDEEKSKRLIELDVDMVTASIWAALSETYVKTHLGKTVDDFYKIKDNLKRLFHLKVKEDKHLPHIKIYNVICNLNYKEIQQMVDFALETEAEFIEFQVMDIVDGATSFLTLSNGQANDIKGQFDVLLKRPDLCFKDLRSFNLSSKKERELKEFPGRFIKVPQGFFFHEEIKEQRVQGAKPEVRRWIECSQGISTKPSVTNPICDEENNIFIFSFLNEKCQRCPRPDCPLDERRQLKIRFLSILGFASFWRRLNSTNICEQTYPIRNYNFPKGKGDISNGAYEKGVIDSLPCYVGWIYSRILSTGEVIPCCKSVNKPLGNINKDKFSDIWNSGVYREFRYNAKVLLKSNFYFKEVNCYKSCDNVGMNLQIKELLSNKIQKGGYRKKDKKVNGECSLPEAKIKLIIPASEFKSGNLNARDHSFGKGIVIDGGEGFGFARYEIYVKEAGRYEFWSYYATEESRPVELYFDDSLITKEALNSVTSGWTTDDLRWFKEAEFNLSKGEHILEIYTKDFIPHIHSFALLKGVRRRGDKRDNRSCASLARNKYLSEGIYQEPAALKSLMDKFKTLGFINSAFKFLNYVRSGRLMGHYLDILGIFNGRFAFKGPFHVQIDLTNNCNNNCIGCWCNSPLLEEKALSPVEKRQALPLGLIKELLEELSEIGTKEVYFSGGGEPFIHPEIMEILAYTKKKGFTCYVNTNFTLLDKERIKRLIDLGVEHLTVSTWAATPQTYALTHPNKNAEVFKVVIENLKFLNKVKRKIPYIKLYNVIFNLNYQELKEMITLAKETGAESVEFTLIDTIPGKTDRLLLNPAQIEELQRTAREITGGLDKNGYFDGVLLFRFDSFLRRISSSPDLSKATYDRNIIDKIPCYIGWYFSRIMPNGDVNACLKAHRIPTGNLYQARFRDIWNGEKQRYFRKKTLVYAKNDPFFRLIGNDPDIKEAGCYKSCDDIGRNVYMHNRIMSLTSFERQLLKITAKIKRRPKLNLNSQDKSKDLIIQGIHNGRKAFTGPEQVVIDITNRCNERCIGCWLYSPLLKEKPRAQWLRQEITSSKAKSLIDDLANLGTKRIRFTGGGEPFMHPNIMELIEYTKAKGLICCITTNFSLLNKSRVKDLIKFEVDELAISLWASNEKTYQKTHPGVATDTFKKIKENLMILTHEKKHKPFVTLCHVICNLNYQEVEEMYRFAQDTGVDGVYFTLVDIIKGATDCLLLDEGQRQEVLKQAEKIKQIQQGLAREKRVNLDYFNGFISRLKEEDSSAGNYDQQRVNQIPCYAGWIFARILSDGTVCPCCRGVKKPMGNVNERDFKDIWFSQNYNEFRVRAKYLSKTDSYFSDVGCMKMCDNLMHNEQIQLRLNLYLKEHGFERSKTPFSVCR